MPTQNQYMALLEKHQREIHAFPFFFAFDKKQFAKRMAEFGLSPDDTDKIKGFGGTGGYYLKSDDERLNEILDRHHRERQAALAADKTGYGYIYDMFLFELVNQEFSFTDDPEDTLDVLGFSWEDVNSDRRLVRGLKKAMAELRRRQKGR